MRDRVKVLAPSVILNPREGKVGLACAASAEPASSVHRGTGSSSLFVYRNVCKRGRGTTGTMRCGRVAFCRTTRLTGRTGINRV